MKQFIISIPYMHPVCPISLSHARIFILADTLGRYKRKNNFKVYMPIGIHFSGSEILRIYQELKNNLGKQEDIRKNKTCQLFLNYYKIKMETLKKFKNPLSILDYFSKQHIKNLKELKTSFNFERVYKTNDLEYEKFVKDLFKTYEEKKLIKNTRNGKAFDFNKTGWKEKSILQLSSTKIIGRGGEKILMEAIQRLDDNWVYERERGIGTEINGNIINPMFDSQLYTLFESRKLNYELPVDIFFAEYHLSVWLATKICFETIILSKKNRTKSYFLSGMAFSREGKRMSSSRGTSILLPDLLQNNKPSTIRISILLAGHPNKDFKWDETMLYATNKIIKNFDCFKKNVKSFSKKKNSSVIKIVNESKFKIRNHIEGGDFRLACIEALVLFPKKIKKLKEIEGKKEIEDFLNYASYVFLPK